jgi:hypothetical protein
VLIKEDQSADHLSMIDMNNSNLFVVDHLPSEGQLELLANCLIVSNLVVVDHLPSVRRRRTTHGGTSLFQTLLWWIISRRIIDSVGGMLVEALFQTLLWWIISRRVGSAAAMPNSRQVSNLVVVDHLPSGG